MAKGAQRCTGLGFVRGRGTRIDEAWWYRIDSVSAQVDDLTEFDSQLVMSGGVAADRVRPWRVPTVAIVYGAFEAQAMDELGFVPAESASTSTVLLRPFPDDRFANEAELAGSLRIAPRLHLMADLIGLGGDDRTDAAARFAEHRSSRD